MTAQPADVRESEQVARFVSSGQAALLVTALMLPVSGAIVRYIGFEVAGFGQASWLAISASVGELAIAGLRPVLGVLLALVFGTGCARLYKRVRNPVALAFILVILLIPIVLIVGLGYLLAFVAVGAAMAFILHVRVGRSPRSVWGISVLLLIYALMAVWYGLQGGSAQPAHVAFDRAVAADGYYIPVGTTDTTVLLAPCSVPRAILEVQSSDVRSLRYDAPQRVDLITLLSVDYVSVAFPFSVFRRLSLATRTPISNFPSEVGYLFIGPAATNSPTSSTLNFPKGDNRANGVTVALSGSGTLSVTYVAASS